jgi:hypothetical protein
MSTNFSWVRRNAGSQNTRTGLEPPFLAKGRIYAWAAFPQRSAEIEHIDSILFLKRTCAIEIFTQNAGMVLSVLSWARK